MLKIPITKPFFDSEEQRMIVKPIKTGWIVQGPYVEEFEKRIADFTGAKYAVAVNSCTSGQFIMSRIIGLQPRDEVIIPSFSWISTANSVEFLGAKAVFCDIDINTFDIDAAQIEEKITKKTKAIYPVHLFGLAADMQAVMKIANKHHIKVVEDCACGLGAEIGNKHVGLFGLGGILSFHPRKSITTGEGGMVITGKKSVADMVMMLREHGTIKTDFARHKGKGGYLLTEYPILGYNMRMTDLQGALGVAQSKKIKRILKIKKELAKEYDNRLKKISWLGAPQVPKGYTHGYQAYCTLFRPEETKAAIRKKSLMMIDRLHEERNAVMSRLEECGISTRQGTHAIHIQELYKTKYDFSPMDFPASYVADKLTIALPFFPSITNKEIEYLFDNLGKVKI